MNNHFKKSGDITAAQAYVIHWSGHYYSCTLYGMREKRTHIQSNVLLIWITEYLKLNTEGRQEMENGQSCL